jgi:hypothetical protein
MAYDSTTGATVLFSGETSPAGSGSPALASDTWTWSGAAWTQQATAPAPPARYGGVFDDDPALGGPLLLAGAGASGALSDGWLWSKQGWVEAHPAGPASPQEAVAGGYDAATSSFVVFGGTGPGGEVLANTAVVTASLPPVASPQVRPQPPAPTTTTVPTAAAHPTPTSPATTAKPAPTTTVTLQTPAPRPVLAQPRTMTLVANVHTVRQGATVQLSGSGFQPGSIVTITFHSTPALIGHSVADSNGEFTATVDVPRSASPGQHHFVAQGQGPSGAATQLVAAVFVLGPTGSHRPTPLETGLLIGLALAIPGGAWMAMSGSAWWRRRRSPAAE